MHIPKLVVVALAAMLTFNFQTLAEPASTTGTTAIALKLERSAISKVTSPHENEKNRLGITFQHPAEVPTLVPIVPRRQTVLIAGDLTGHS